MLKKSVLLLLVSIIYLVSVYAVDLELELQTSYKSAGFSSDLACNDDYLYISVHDGDSQVLVYDFNLNYVRNYSLKLSDTRALAVSNQYMYYAGYHSWDVLKFDLNNVEQDNISMNFSAYKNVEGLDFYQDELILCQTSDDCCYKFNDSDNLGLFMNYSGMNIGDVGYYYPYFFLANESNGQLIWYNMDTTYREIEDINSSLEGEITGVCYNDDAIFIVDDGSNNKIYKFAVVNETVGGGVPPIEEIIEIIRGGANIQEILYAWNPEVYELLENRISELFDADNLAYMIPNLIDTVRLMIRFIFREPAFLGVIS